MPDSVTLCVRDCKGDAHGFETGVERNGCPGKEFLQDDLADAFLLGRISAFWSIHMYFVAL
jgi:hypothetical protein